MPPPFTREASKKYARLPCPPCKGGKQTKFARGISFPLIQKTNRAKKERRSHGVLPSKLFYYNVIGNIALFIPFGYFISDKLRAQKTSQIIYISAIISLTAELIQYKIGRAFDIDDVLLNVSGAIIGFMLYVSIQAIKRHLPKTLQNNIFYNILAIIVLLLIVLVFGSIWGIIL